MRFLKALVMGWALFFGAQSALACGEKPHCVCPVSDVLASAETELGEERAPVFMRCMARFVDIGCIWPFAWPCLLPMSCCCPTCGVAAEKTASKEAAVIAVEPKGHETAAGRVQERKANLTKEETGNT